MTAGELSSKVEDTADSLKGAAGNLTDAARDVADSTKERASDAANDMLEANTDDDIPQPMRLVKGLGITSGMAYTAGVISILLSLSMWFFRRGGNRETAERLAIFVGLWPPTFMAIGKALEGYEHPGR
jgi:hypothetical protein